MSTLVSRLAAAGAAYLFVFSLASWTQAQQSAPVTIKDDGTAYTLDNGIATARVDKSSGDLVSLRYKNAEMLATIMGADGMPDMKADPAGANGRGFGPFTDHQYGFWSHDAMGPRGTGDATAKITVDPASNGGEGGEVSVKGISNGRLMGTGPGSNANGNFISDIEIRWAMGRGTSGIYTYCVFEHQPQYASSTITEARFCVKLNDFFDYMSIADDPHHFKHYPKDLREGDKYVYTTDQFNNPAFGWSSTTNHVGLFLLNPTVEYLSGGPTKVEFLGHRDTNQVAAPCVLNYWRSSHYGGAEVSVGAGEHWTKVIGPFLLYVNSGTDPQAIYKDARDQQAKEAAAWPYFWVNGVDYPHAEQRSAVSGQLVLSDSQMANAKLPHLMVGLAAPAYKSTAAGFGGGRTIDWQTDAKHYEFWVRGNEDGTFSIPKVRAGNYTMHAFADGVLGEFAKTDITVEEGKPLDLGKLTWTPVRHGQQVWDIGIPNRNGSEFFKGDVFYSPDISKQYATLFPNDITYTIGKSDYTKDWFFQQVPHYDKDLSDQAAERSAAATRAAATQPGGRGGRRGQIVGFGFGGPPAIGKPTPYTVDFNMADASTGTASLRVAMSGTSVRALDIVVNGTPAGALSLPVQDGVISNHGSSGIWYETMFQFDASRLKKGDNSMVITVPGGNVTNGVIYDYLRLELDSATPFSGK